MSLEKSLVLQKCNNCEKSKKGDKPFQLYFANCGHLICDECRNSEGCPICDKETNYVKIDDNLPANLKMFFQDPCPMIKQYSKVIEFQNLQSGIVQNQLNQQKKNLQQQVAKLQKETKDQAKELSYLKARCSDLEHELKRRDEQLSMLIRVDEKLLTKKRTPLLKDDPKFDFKPDETKSTFFDPSQINFKQLNDETKSPYQDSAKSPVSLPTQPNLPKNFNKNRNQSNSKNKITYDNLNYYLK